LVISGNDTAIHGSAEASSIGTASQTADASHLMPSLADLQKLANNGGDARAKPGQINDPGLTFLTMLNPFAPSNVALPDSSNNMQVHQSKPSPYDEVAKALAKKYDIKPQEFRASGDQHTDGLQNQVVDLKKSLQALSTQDIQSIFKDRLSTGASPSELSQSIQRDCDQVLKSLTPQERFKLQALADTKTIGSEPIKNFQGYRGEGIHSDIPQGEVQAASGDSLQSIARKHLGKHASESDVIKYSKEIAKTNFGGDVNHVIHPGDTVKLPGHKKDGTFTYEGADGKNITVRPNGTVEREGDKQQQQREKDKTERTAEAAEHKKLEAQADKLKEPQRSQFKKDMAEFEKRAAKDGLSPQEVTDTYKQMERMLDGKDDQHMAQKDRLVVAAEVMHRAAHPTETNQGFHGTCNVATVEVRTYTKHPAEAARLVADVSLTGQYKAKDGTVVHQEPLYHGDSVSNPRDRASEIFQVTAVNIHYAKENAKTNPPGQLRYVQTTVPPPGDTHDTGERVKDFSKNPPDGEDVKVNGKVLDNPNLYPNDIVEISEAITGTHDKGMLFEAAENSKGIRDDRIVNVHSEAELQQKLAEAKANGQMPIIVDVFCNNEPFYSDENHGPMTKDPGRHVVTISDYQPGPPAQVEMHNQWGPKTCHGVSVHDLYRAMKQPTDSIKDLQKDVDWNRAHNQVDYQKEFELLDLKRNLGQINDQDCEQQTKVLINGMKKHFEQDHPSKEERGRDILKMNDVINELPVAAQIRLFKQAYEDGILDDATYQTDLSLAGWRVHVDYSRASENKDSAEQKKIIDASSEAAVELGQALEELPEAERQQILKQINDWNNRYTGR
jgi:hypothetical protein